MSKDVTQKLVKTQDHYEELIKNNMVCILNVCGDISKMYIFKPTFMKLITFLKGEKQSYLVHFLKVSS